MALLHLRMLLSLAAVAAAPAQQGASLLLGDFRVPLHTAPPDPVAGAYGTWGAGHAYKASFHDGFRVHPRLGRSAPRSLPLGWRTEGVWRGASAVFEGGDRRGDRDGDWRYAFRHPGVVEAYDLGADGVVQTFTFPALPAGAGDLVVAGTVETALTPLAASWDQAVGFADERQVVRLTLGTATARDARGRPVPVRRTWETGRLGLRVLAVDLAAVQFPLVLQQLVAPVGLVTGKEYSDVDFGDWDGNAYVVATSHWSAPDADSHAFQITPTWAMSLVWADVASQWSTERVRLGCGPWGGMRVTGQRTHTLPAVSEVFVHHQREPALGGGSWAFAPVSTGYTQRNPELDVTGLNGTRLAWQEDLTTTNADTATTRVCVASFDEPANAFGPKWIVAGDPSIDAQDPAIHGGMVVWRQRAGSAAGQVHGRGIDGSGPVAGPALHLSAAHADSDCRRPRVAMYFSWFWPGTGLCSYEFASGGEQGVAAVSLAAGMVAHERELWRAAQPARLHDVVMTATSMHAYVLHERGGHLRATRLGRTGGTVAEHVVDLGTAACAALASRHWGTAAPLPTPVVFVRSAARDQVWLGTVTFSPFAKLAQYGSTCGGHLTPTALASDVTLPFAGGQLQIALSGVPVGAPCQLWVAAAPGSSPLPGGCTFLLDATATVAQAFAFSPGWFWTHELKIPLADDPVFLGNLYLQATWQDPALGGVTSASNGMEAWVR